MDQQSAPQPIDTQPNAPTPKKRRTWLIALAISLGVVFFLAMIYGALALLLVLGSNKAGTYLNGAAITVSDEAIETRVQSDMKWLLTGDYASFDQNLSLDEAGKAYRQDIDQLQQAGSCTLTKESITKGQGGFDGGAHITYTGNVDCAGGKAYSLAVDYGGTALSKKDAADMGRFTLREVTATASSEALVRTYMQRTGESLQVKVVPVNPTPAADRTQKETRMYASVDEYNKAVQSGELQGCGSGWITGICSRV